MSDDHTMPDSLKMVIEAKARDKSFFDFNFNDINGIHFDMKDLRTGWRKCRIKAVIVVNVASKWGLTDTNYKQLESMFKMYKNKGLAVLAVPCNQFGQ